MIKRRSTQLTFRQSFDEFISVKKSQGLSKYTINNFTHSYRLFINTLGIDEDTIVTVSQKGVSDFIRANSHLKGSSINNHLAFIRVWLNYCADNGYISPISIKFVKYQQEEIVVYTEQQLLNLLKKPKGDNFVEWRCWCVVNFILGTGVRRSSIVNIKVEDVDFEGRTIRIRHTKNKKPLMLPMSNTLYLALKEYLKLFDVGEYLFPSSSGRILDADALHNSYVKYCHSRGVSNTSIHSLRHSFAKYYIKSGGSTFELQKILGHSTLEMTKRYVQIFDEDVDISHSALDILSNKRVKKKCI